MKKRAQLMSHPFTVILTLIVAAFIIFFGFKVVKDLYTIGKQADLVSFSGSLQKEVNTYYALDEGSQKRISIFLPEEVSHVCIVDQSADIDYSLIPNNKENLVRTLTNKNVFFIPYPNQQTKDPVYINNLKPLTNPLCIKTNSKLEATIVSKGTHVIIQ